MAALNPIHLGYDTKAKPRLFTISYDVRTLITGLNVNQGILKTNQLEEIVKYRQNLVTADKLPVVVKWYYDPRYAGMAPLRCSSINGTVEYCTLRMNEVIFNILMTFLKNSENKANLVCFRWSCSRCFVTSEPTPLFLIPVIAASSVRWL
jgi:hypothetical protein